MTVDSDRTYINVSFCWKIQLINAVLLKQSIVNSHLGMFFCRSFCWTATVQKGDFCDAY